MGTIVKLIPTKNAYTNLSAMALEIYDFIFSFHFKYVFQTAFQILLIVSSPNLTISVFLTLFI